ncbi:MAG: OmpA/MotB family protein [Desulfohalobiaceae bacterium]
MSQYLQPPKNLFLNLSRSQDAAEPNVRWAVPWSDLMLVMFILFLVLYAFHAREEKNYVPSNSPVNIAGQHSSEQGSDLNLQAIYARAQDKLQFPNSPISISKDQQGQVIISLSGDVFFNPGSVRLNPEAQEYLERIAEVLSLAQGRIVVAGFAAQNEMSQPKQRSYFEISALRAAKIAEQLNRSSNFRSENLVIQGLGVAKPRVPGTSEQARQQNRRVEIKIQDHK